MPENERATVVFRFRDGHAVRCRLSLDFTPGDRTVDAETEDGDRITVAVDQLKAVFFLKDPLRREFEMQLGERAGDPPRGALARVEFLDGEIINGRMESYSMEDHGFFLYPTSLESNNERIFVVAQALRTLAIEG